ncbi:MAG: hypothetical protein M0Z52_02355 [Actinomycetota bacterium]|nr:hypothetical protein [Nitrospiraceae bacterium]MDA8155281.1 hypothetical protein [Actinomycetota bacterium]
MALCIIIGLPSMIKKLPALLKFVKYWIKNRRGQIQFNIGANEQPSLVLVYPPRQRLLFGILVLLVFLGSLAFFLKASAYAHDDANFTSFFGLSKGLSYILYYVTLNVWGIFLFSFFSVMVFSMSYKRILFFKKGVIKENCLIGSIKLPLNKHMWLIKQKTKDKSDYIYSLYDDLNDIKIAIVSRIFMTLDAKQDKLLDDYVSKIPETKKNFAY